MDFIEASDNMKTTGTKEKDFEDLIINHLQNVNGFEVGSNKDYSKEFAYDEARLLRFLLSTQKAKYEKLKLDEEVNRRKFFSVLYGEISKRGIVDVLRRGIKVYPVNNITLYYVSANVYNEKAIANYRQNIFSVTRQLEYSEKNSKLALDLCLFINGLPIITCELKNSLSGQKTVDAVEQYKKDRLPTDTLFSFKRCMVHFAFDDLTVAFCTKLARKNSWFLPLNKGYNYGGGNPPNPNGMKTAYLWEQILTKGMLSKIIESYAQVTVKQEKNGDKQESQVFPRYHQLDCVEKLVESVKLSQIGSRYLIQHSAGSGKSNSITWLAYQLVGLEKDGVPMLDSVIVVTDRINLDKQIRNNIRLFMQGKSIIGWAKHSGDLRKFILEGKRLIISIVEKFPYILEDIGKGAKGKHFAIIIDEAHSSQGGTTSAKMNLALSGEFEAEEDSEDKVNNLLGKIVEGRKMLSNASYFAFTATPKNKTLEVFGTPCYDTHAVIYKPFHEYSMKQAIEEGFILDVLKSYTPVKSYYKIIKTISENPDFDKKKAQAKLRAMVESRAETIQHKAWIMVDHFLRQVAGKRKINGKARAMVVTSGIERAVEYYHAIKDCLKEAGSQYKVIVAFSDKTDKDGNKLTDSQLNGFPSSQIEERFKKDPYRIMVVADKFQTGYDEPLLHTMYVDKVLSGIKAVQTLSRLNRSHPEKRDTFILDFANEPDDIKSAFEQYYKSTILLGETDPNRLYELQMKLEQAGVYSTEEVEKLVELYFTNADRWRLDVVLDTCAARYEELSDKHKIRFKSSAKVFCKIYGYLSSILPEGNIQWEKMALFLRYLIPKLPNVEEENLSEGILEAVELGSYRNEIQQTMSLVMEGDSGIVSPTSTATAEGKRKPEMAGLDDIVKEFNDRFGNIRWSDTDSVRKAIESLPNRVSNNVNFQNAVKSNAGREKARNESDEALMNEIMSMIDDNFELFREYTDNVEFKEWLSGNVFQQAYGMRQIG